jgi:hypothetical protein
LSSRNKTQPTAVSVEAFLAGVEPPARRADAEALSALMAKVSGETPVMWGPSIVGFGAHHYRYDSGREGDMPAIAFAPRKPALVLYLSAASPARPGLLTRLGPHEVGKGCLYLKRLDAVDAEVLETLIQDTWDRRA